MATYAYRNPQTTRVSRRASLVGSQAPELHLSIPDSFSSASSPLRPPSSSTSRSVLYVPTSFAATLTPSLSTFSDKVAAKASEYIDNPGSRWSLDVAINLLKRVHYVHILCFIWVVLIWFGERTYPYNSLRACSWNQWEDWPELSRPARVVLVSDPQIVDTHTYPGRPRILQALTEYMTDLYLRRNWVYINDILDADANFFIGDLFDGGREWGEREWHKEFKRFGKIYTKPPYKKTIMSLPGNHDIGFGNTIVYPAFQRFHMFFGDSSSTHVIGNHTFVLLDTISLMNSENATIYGAPQNFIQDISSLDSFEEYPRILLTHVPLFRDPSLSCGPHRESKKPIPFVRGLQYQTMISPEVSDWVLRSTKPSVVFSGDDHDSCYVKHDYTAEIAGAQRQRHADEYTVKSASMAMGVARPAVQLLSLHNEQSAIVGTAQGETFQTEICYMPNPFYAIILYALFAIFSLTIILVVNFLPPLFPPLLRNILSKRPWPSSQYSILESPRISYGHTPVLPTYAEEDEFLESRKSPSFSAPSPIDRKLQSKNTIWRAKRMMRQKRKWATILLDVVTIIIIGAGFFMFLAASIYWT